MLKISDHGGAVFGGGGVATPKINLFTGLTEPSKKDGLWIQKEGKFPKIQEKYLYDVTESYYKNGAYYNPPLHPFEIIMKQTFIINDVLYFLYATSTDSVIQKMDFKTGLWESVLTTTSFDALSNAISDDRYIYIVSTAKSPYSTNSIQIFDTETFSLEERLSVFPKGFNKSALVIVDNILYSICGGTGSSTTNSTLMYGLNLDTFEIVLDSSATFSTKSGSAIHHNGLIYHQGGEQSSEYVYDITEKTWTKTNRTSIPQFRNIIPFIDGEYVCYIYSNSLYKIPLDITNTNIIITAIKTGDGGTVIINGSVSGGFVKYREYLYRVGGRMTEELMKINLQNATLDSQFYAYPYNNSDIQLSIVYGDYIRVFTVSAEYQKFNLLTSKSELLIAPVTINSSSRFIKIGKYCYFFTGSANSIHILDLTTDTWTLTSPCPIVVDLSYTTATDGKRYIYLWAHTVNSLYRYDTLLDIWVLLDSKIPVTGFYSTAPIIDDKIYLFSGGNTGKGTLVYDLKSNSYTFTSQLTTTGTLLAPKSAGMLGSTFIEARVTSSTLHIESYDFKNRIFSIVKSLTSYLNAKVTLDVHDGVVYILVKDEAVSGTAIGSIRLLTYHPYVIKRSVEDTEKLTLIDGDLIDLSFGKSFDIIDTPKNMEVSLINPLFNCKFNSIYYGDYNEKNKHNLYYGDGEKWNILKEELVWI